MASGTFVSLAGLIDSNHHHVQSTPTVRSVLGALCYYSDPSKVRKVCHGLPAEVQALWSDPDKPVEDGSRSDQEERA
ncbi:hypothetical protein E0H62_05650 [Rhizobium leguminosarum bv. viciae]|nr:hypothetical protein E0H62_05650 [Rhizobium leguminosarum bv. viciae]